MIKRANILMREVIEEARALNIPISNKLYPSIRVHERKTSWGTCKKEYAEYSIYINRILLEQGSDKAIKQTIMHELLHTCPDCFNHGATWKRYGAMVNRAYGYDVSRLNSAENLGISEGPRKANAKYTIVCSKCAAEIYRQKRSALVDNPGAYRCKCGGKLEVR